MVAVAGYSYAMLILHRCINQITISFCIRKFSQALTPRLMMGLNYSDSLIRWSSWLAIVASCSCIYPFASTVPRTNKWEHLVGGTVRIIIHLLLVFWCRSNDQHCIWLSCGGMHPCSKSVPFRPRKAWDHSSQSTKYYIPNQNREYATWSKLCTVNSIKVLGTS